MSTLKPGILQWAIGLFCLLTGVLMAVTPYQFNSAIFQPMQPYLVWFGAGFFACGAALLLGAVLGAPRSARVAFDLLAGAMLWFLASRFWLSGAWTGLAFYGVLGLAMLLTPWLEGSRPGTAPRRAGLRPEEPEAGAGSRDSAHGALPPSHGRDLFALAFGAGEIIVGGLLLLPGRFDEAFYAIARLYLPWHGLGFVLGGAALIAVHLAPPRSRAVYRLAHLLASAASLAFCLTAALPSRTWTGALLYGGFGLLIGLLPWVERSIQNIDPSALRTRLSSVVIVMTLLPLVASVVFLSRREETVATAEALRLQQRLVGALAHDIAGYIRLHQSLAGAIAAQPGLLDLPPDQQRSFLATYGAAYPEVDAIATYDAAGAPLARSDGSMALPAAGLGFFESARASGRPTAEVRVARASGMPLVTLAAPVRDARGEFAGLVAVNISISEIDSLLDTATIDPVDSVYLVDDGGRVIVHTDATLDRGSDLSAAAPVVALRGGSIGSLRYGQPGQVRLAGFAAIPALGWGIVAERSQAASLRAVRSGQDLTLLILLLLFVCGALIGIGAATRLTGPLVSLGAAIDRFDTDGPGDAAPGAPPAGGGPVRELAALTTAFANLRARLVARTAERDRAERDLRAEREWLRITLSSIGDAVIATDTAGRVIFMNHIAEALTGWAAAAARDKPIEQIFHIISEETRAPVISPVADVLARGTIVGLANHTLLIAADGREYPIDDSGAPIRDAAGAIQGVVLVFRDVTARKREADRARFFAEAGAALAASLDIEATMATLANLIVPVRADWCAVDLVQSDGGLRRLALAHRDPARVAWAEALRQRYPDSQETDAGLLEVIRSGEPALFNNITAEMLAASARDAEHLRILQELGVAAAMLVPLIARGRTVGAMTFVSAESGYQFTADDLADAAELGRRAALAIENARLYGDAQEAIRIRDQFLSIASHELRTPTTAIIGNAQLLERRLRRLDGTSDREFRPLDAIVRQGGRLNRLIGSLLDLSRLQSGRLILAQEAVDLGALAERICQELQLLTERHQLEVRLGAGPLLVDGDELRLEQVVYNLIHNALKYSPAGGEVRVEVGGRDGQVGLIVRDEGLGIPAGDLPHLFQRFYRAGNVTPTPISGMGLGLYIVREVVELHGGALTVESTEGVGSAFGVFLPCSSAASEPAQAKIGS